MKHLIQPNRWSCLPCSTAMACGVSVEKIYEIIGHDGSEIIHPILDEPFCRRAFHIQECIWAAWKLGFFVMPFEVSPRLAATPGYIIDIPIKFDMEEILTGWGIMTGEGKRGRHAIAYSAGVGYDPNGQIIDFGISDFKVDTIWKFDLIF